VAENELQTRKETMKARRSLRKPLWLFPSSPAAFRYTNANMVRCGMVSHPREWDWRQSPGGR
jgi:hypothetical protein